MKELWSKEQEIRFFTEFRKSAAPEQLFYLSDDNRYYAYWPKSYSGSKSTLQARNALIGDYTEKWSADLLSEFAQSNGYHVVKGAVCEELGLPQKSPADVAICRTKNVYQKAEDILLIIEVKMSIVWNWELQLQAHGEKLVCLGDYTTHRGNPGLLRSDTVLKAIGKCLNVRISSFKASGIPIIVLGNTPITRNYYEKVDHLKRGGIIQGFWSVNPKPLDKSLTPRLLNNGEESIKATEGLGFYRFDTYDEFLKKLEELFREEREFFSSMRTEDELGKFIEIANREATYEKKAEKFLTLIRG
ncbi:MAG: hypothetical protein HQ588_06770 [Deltaproteobacteria bacterium]|nr:hypothetical protein [Deltaproteobacteria bacterium]